MFTPEILEGHNGSIPGVPIYLAILGTVFDVTKGFVLGSLKSVFTIFSRFRDKHYGLKGGYSFFAGRDGSRAFVSGPCEPFTL